MMLRMTMFSRLRPMALVFVTLLITIGGFAQETSPTAPTGNNCTDAVTTSAMRVCEKARYDAAQRELNAAYQTLLQHLDSEQKQKLRAAQRAWIRFRDTNAEFESSLAQGGTLAPLIRIGSLTEMTRNRVSELKKATLP
jgi:uncharacterized protein YecT (DUF1311 family)